MAAPRWIIEAAHHPNDPITGAKIMQLTGHVAMATNIYDEDPPCSPQNRIVVTRSMKCDQWSDSDLYVVDVDEHRSIQVDSDMNWHFGAAPVAYGDIFYYPRKRYDVTEYVRLTLSTLEKEVVYTFAADEPRFGTLGSASPDGSHITTMRDCDDEGKEVIVMEIATGEITRIIAGEDFINPHPRFDRMDGKYVLVQHNRGQTRDSLGQRQRNALAKLGSTLHLVARDGSTREELPIANPAIKHGISGHESWVKGQMAFVTSLSPVDGPYSQGGRSGNLVHLKIGDDQPTCIADAPHFYFGHVSTSSCGKYWCCDAWEWDHVNDPTRTGLAPRVIVGCIRTNKFETVCDVGGFWPRYENGHAHPYLSFDNKYVIFVSTRTGLPQVFRAEIPDGLLDRIEEE